MVISFFSPCLKCSCIFDIKLDERFSLPHLRTLFTLGSVYSTSTSRAEHKTETNNSLARGKALRTYMRGRGFELGATENPGSG